MMDNHIRPNTVVVILKIVERCNINCTYCYFFNGIDDSYKYHQGRIKLETVEKIAIYFRNACIENHIKVLRIDFHGGEPLLVKPKYLSAICDVFIKFLKPITKLEFTLQTNAMLINQEWVSVFNQYQINLGISIDGPEEYHDKYRIDHRGRGTYSKTREKIDFLRKNYRQGNVNFGIGVLSVINPEFSARKIYRHFVDELKFNSFDFLLPDNTWDSIKLQQFNPEKYGIFLCELFDEWINDNNPKIYIRILNSIIAKLTYSKIHFHDFGGWLNDFLLVTISSNGDISPDDTYRSADPDLMNTYLKVDNSNFNDLIHHPSIHLLYNSANKLASHCLTCEWKNICKSGSLLHRFTKNENFTKHSVYCDGLKIIYRKISDYLINKNIMKYSEIL